MKNFLFIAFMACLVSCGEIVNKHPVVVMETTMGTIVLTLDAEKSPVTVRNFLSYVEESFYDSTIFHRIIPGSIIQGGGYGVLLNKKTTKPPIKNESGNGLVNKRGSIAMARLSQLNSATSQFYINHRNNFGLDELKYIVFGEVTDGMEVVDNIAQVKTWKRSAVFTALPVEPVVILTVRVKEQTP